jgi:hypothetical protein
MTLVPIKPKTSDLPTGVYRHKGRPGPRCFVQYGHRYIGYFKNPEEAQAAYLSAKKRWGRLTRPAPDDVSTTTKTQTPTATSGEEDSRA